MLSMLYVAGPHVKQPLADELSWVNMFWLDNHCFQIESRIYMYIVGMAFSVDDLTEFCHKTAALKLATYINKSSVRQ